MDAKEYLVTFVIKKIRKVFQENGFEAQNDGDMCLIGCQGNSIIFLRIFPWFETQPSMHP
jgi:hypothetical protein